MNEWMLSFHIWELLTAFLFHLCFICLFQRRSGKNRSDLQILTLDDTLTGTNINDKTLNNQAANVDRLEETFRREGNTEILELSHSTLEDSIGGDESSDRIRSRQVL